MRATPSGWWKQRSKRLHSNNWRSKSFPTSRLFSFSPRCTALFSSPWLVVLAHETNNRSLIGAANFCLNNHKNVQKCLGSLRVTATSTPRTLHFLLTTKNLINFYAIFTIIFPFSRFTLSLVPPCSINNKKCFFIPENSYSIMSFCHVRSCEERSQHVWMSLSWFNDLTRSHV